MVKANGLLPITAFGEPIFDYADRAFAARTEHRALRRADRQLVAITPRTIIEETTRLASKPIDTALLPFVVEWLRTNGLVYRLIDRRSPEGLSRAIDALRAEIAAGVAAERERAIVPKRGPA